MRTQNQAARAHLDALPSKPWFLSTMQAVLSRPRAGKPVSAVVQEAADPLAFAAEHSGLR